jgi:hypothetical protein
MLITPLEVISFAYITNLDETLIKEEIISSAQYTYIRPILTEPLYNDVVANPIDYSALIGKFIKPCLAFYVKYLIYSQQLFESAAYSSPDPTKAKELIDPSNAALITNEVHQNIINDILFIARQKEQELIADLIASQYPLYEQPTTKRISGILIKT